VKRDSLRTFHWRKKELGTHIILSRDTKYTHFMAFYTTILPSSHFLTTHDFDTSNQKHCTQNLSYHLQLGLRVSLRWPEWTSIHGFVQNRWSQTKV